MDGFVVWRYAEGMGGLGGIRTRRLLYELTVQIHHQLLK